MIRKSYNTSDERQPSKAAVKSYFAADQDTKSWESAQLNRKVVDQDGTEWQIKIRREEDYLAHKHLKPFGIMVNISLTYLAQSHSLIQCGIFSELEDERLLGLLGEAIVPIELKAFYLEGTEKSDVDREIRARVEVLAKEMPAKSLRDLKRKFVMEWIHQSRGFSKK